MTSVNTHVISSKTNDRAARVQGTHLLTWETMHFPLATAMVKITLCCQWTHVLLQVSRLNYIIYMKFSLWRD
jgi:hypothetical protein